jgi:hypothetical protein|tara:strand:- start:372 stop:719 length:348 start_codon:yes stop_codon:yes gene_type:complete
MIQFGHKCMVYPAPFFSRTLAPLQLFFDPRKVCAAQQVKVGLSFDGLPDDPVWTVLMVLATVDYGRHKISVEDHQVVRCPYCPILKLDLQVCDRFDVGSRQRSVDSIEVSPCSFL